MVMDETIIIHSFTLCLSAGEKEAEDKDMNSEAPSSLSEAISEKETNSVSQSNAVSSGKDEERSNSIKKVSWHFGIQNFKNQSVLKEKKTNVHLSSISAGYPSFLWTNDGFYSLERLPVRFSDSPVENPQEHGEHVHSNRKIPAGT